jgi:hypothetical protein
MNTYLGVPLNLANVLLLVSGLALVNLVLLFTLAGLRIEHLIPQTRAQLIAWKEQLKYIRQHQIITYVSLILLAVLALNFILQNTFWPLYDWDALALYDFRAKVFVDTGDISAGKELGYFYHYPPFTSLLHTYTYLAGLTQVKLWYVYQAFAMMLIFYAQLRRSVPQAGAVFGTLLLTISPRIYGQIFAGYTNLPYTICAGLGFIYLGFWLQKGERTDLIKAVLLIAASTWIRTTEPFWLLFYPLALIGWWKYKKQIGWLLLGGVFLYYFKAPWSFYVADLLQAPVTSPVNTIQAVQLDATVSQFLARLWVTTKFLYDSVAPGHLPYLAAMLISIISSLYFRAYTKLWGYLIYAAMLGLIWAGTFIFSYLFNGWTEIPDSAARMAMVLFPLSIFLIIDSPLWSMTGKKTERKA